MADGNFVVYVDVNTGKRQSRFGQQVGTEITGVCARAPPSAGAAAPGGLPASCVGWPAAAGWLRMRGYAVPTWQYRHNLVPSNRILLLPSCVCVSVATCASFCSNSRAF